MATVVTESLYIAILEQVAETKNVDVNNLEPLYHSVEPEALETLCDHGFKGEFTFYYEGCEVTVSGEGEIQVTDGRYVQ